jgi:periplasmic divalent cation tolerance protein
VTRKGFEGDRRLDSPGEGKLYFEPSRAPLPPRAEVFMENDVVLVLSTASSEKEAITIAQALVEQELAACVNVVPAIRSIYRWKGKIWNEVENMMFIKTTSHLFEEVRKTIKELHSYELPEVLLVKIDDGEKNVLNWIGASVKGGRERF